MAYTITINGPITMDETDGQQNTNVATATEDNNDNDILLATLQANATAFYDRLFDAVIDGGLNLTSIDVAFKADYITLSGSGDISSMGFVSGTGAALPALGGGAGGACNLTALDGGAITLFSDPDLGNRVVYGVDTQGDIVFALYMLFDEDALSADLFMVQFEALDNPVATNHDDPLELTGVKVAISSTTMFNFNELPSGANLFGMLGSGGSGLIVFGTDTFLKGNGTYKNPESDVIQTSQGGINATIGINSQMFNQGDSAYFTFVKNPDPNFTGTNLDPNEADDADNLLYGDNNNATNDLLETNVAFLQISQIQSGVIAGMSITAYNLADSPKGRTLLDDSGENPVAVTRVTVYAADHETVLDDSTWAAGVNSAISFDFSGGVATVTGINAGNWIEWTTSTLHDQVKITGTGGKFDVGGFGLNEPSATSEPLTGVRFEDDGPSVDLELNGTAEVTVDESDIDPNVPGSSVSDSITFANLFSTDDEDFGTDGAGTDSSVYQLVLNSAVSGLTDTLSGDPVVLSILGNVITGSVNAGADVVFTIELDPLTEEITLTQYRAMVHDDDDDPVEEGASALTLPEGTIDIQRTVTDGDDDSGSDAVDISEIFKFEDDGPRLEGPAQAGLELRTEDSGVTDTATLSTDDIFPNDPDFGNDGENQDDPIIYELRLEGTDPDSGLVDTETGQAILLKQIDANNIIGYVTINGVMTEAIRWNLSVPDPDDLITELVTFTQTRAVEHDNILDPVEDTEPEEVNGGLVWIDQYAIDGDGDVSDKESFDLGDVTILWDDGPEIGPVLNVVVDFAAGASDGEDLEGVVGNDPNDTPYKLTYFTPTTFAGDVELHGVLSADDTVVTYYADDDGQAGYGTAGDTAYYKLELGDQGGEGDYTFTVLVDPPPDFTDFDFTFLPSGQSLFGVLVNQDENGIQELGGLGLLVVGKEAVLDGNGAYTNASDTINTSKGGGAVTIGVDNQMFDPGDGAVFVYLDNPDDKSIAINSETGSGGLTQTSADDADTLGFAGTVGSLGGEVEVVQKQGGAMLKMKISAYDVDVPGADDTIVSAADPEQKDPLVNDDVSQEARSFLDNPLAGAAAVSITAINVYDRADPDNILESVINVNGVAVNVDGDGDGNLDDAAGITVRFVEVSPGVYMAEVDGFTANDTIAWTTSSEHDAVLIEGNGGKWDVGGFNVAQGNDTPDQLLDFTARVTDGDGDYNEASWKVGIDGTGQYDDGEVSGVDII